MKTQKEKPKKEKALCLNKMTCAQLAEWVEQTDPETKQPKKNEELLRRYRQSNNMRLLKLCGPLNAEHHYQHCLTARHLAHVPTIEMRVAGGKPDEKKMPSFTPSLKKIGAINGIVIHRWGKGAFILAHPLKENQSASR